MPPRVSSENTTPKPNVSSAALRSQPVISLSGASCLASAAKYSPPGPPPTTAIRISPPLPVKPKVCCPDDGRQQIALSLPASPHPASVTAWPAHWCRCGSIAGALLSVPEARRGGWGDTPSPGVLRTVQVGRYRGDHGDSCAPRRGPPER